MDFEYPAEDDPRRLAVREWLATHPAPTPRSLAEAGYVVPHWPEPWGLDADPLHQLIIDEELGRGPGVNGPENPIAIGWAGPTIIYGGTEEQKDRHLWPMLTGEHQWCQMFSEPGSGSDLAGLSTRAIRDGERYIVNGQKVWTSGAHNSKFGILIAGTDPDAPKHQGISYFICPTDLPGIEMSPIIDATGTHSFNEVFYTDVELLLENRIGEENDGWRLAKVTLGNERISLSGEGALWGSGPSAHDLVDLVGRAGGVADTTMRQRLTDLYIEAECLRLIRLRTLTAQLKGEPPGTEASVRKAIADEHGQKIMRAAKDLTGAAGMLTDRGPLGADSAEWHDGFLFSSALTIGGGTAEVQRNIIAERALGLPHDIDVEAGRSWAEARSTSADR